MPLSKQVVCTLLESETIRASAVRTLDGTVFEAPAHFGAVQRANMAGKPWHDEDLGFVTSEGRFVTREQAELIALKAGQLKPDISDPSMIHAYDFEWMG